MSTLDYNTPTKPPRFANRFERAKLLGSHFGYVVAENIFCPGLFEIRKPDGTTYHIETLPRNGSGWQCDCPARVPNCSHVLFLERCLRYAAVLEARKLQLAERKRVTRGGRRVAALKKLAERTPVQPALPAEMVCAVCEIASIAGPRCSADDCPATMAARRAQELRERCAERMARDF